MITSLLNTLWRERRALSRYEALVELVERAEGSGTIETSGRQLAERWQWPEPRVRRFLDELASAGAIALERIRGTHNGRGRKITLVASAGCASPRRKLTQAVTQAVTQGKPLKRQRVTVPVDASHDAARDKMPLGLGFTPSLQERSSHHTTPGAPRVDGAHEQQPEHLRYAEALASALNEAQAANGLIDRDSFRPVAAHHRGTLEAALAIKNARVPLEFARRYVWQEAQRFKPSGKAQQIGSLAYLRQGMITEWLRSSARTEVQERRGHRGKATAIGDVVEALTRREP